MTRHQMLLLLLELLQSGELPELAVEAHGVVATDLMIRGSAPLGPVALEADICGLATAHLRAIGPQLTGWYAHGRPKLCRASGAAPVAMCTLCQRAARQVRS